MYGLTIRLAFVLIVSAQLVLFSCASVLCKGNDCNVEEPRSDSVKSELHYNPELSYKTLLLAAVTVDNVHPQRCLDKSLPSSKFQLQTFVRKKCDFFSDNCAGYIAVSHPLKAIVIAFRGTTTLTQIIAEGLTMMNLEDFLDGKVNSYFKTGFESLWPGMEKKVKSLVSDNPQYQVWVTGHSLGAALASVTSTWLAHHNIVPGENIILYTFGSPRVGDYKYAQHHDKLIKNSWRVVNYDDIVPHIAPLNVANITAGPYHHGVEVFYSEVAANVNSAHRVCRGKPEDEDKTCSRNQSTVNLFQSWLHHLYYFGITGTHCWFI